jgi:hypothetical protein
MDGDTPYENLKCSICLEYARKAVDCTKCENIFCQQCVRDVKTCPLCVQPVSFKESIFARKLISSISIECPNKCNESIKMGVLDEHLSTHCPNKVYKCNQCAFLSYKVQFVQHILEQHKDNLIQTFEAGDKLESGLDLWKVRKNGKGIETKRGKTGRFYCGGQSDIRCNSCDGRCGPTNGCQCTDCTAIDIEFYGLKRNQMLNHDGVICELSNGLFNCNTKFSSDWKYCNPNHCCDACRTVSQFVSTYKTALKNHFD